MSGPKSMSPAVVSAGQAWQSARMTSWLPLRAASDPPAERTPTKLRMVPSWKTSYQPPVTSAGTRMRGYFVSTSRSAQ